MNTDETNSASAYPFIETSMYKHLFWFEKSNAHGDYRNGQGR